MASSPGLSVAASRWDDADLAGGLERHFGEKRDAARPILLDEVKAWRWARRLRNNLARLFAPYL